MPEPRLRPLLVVGSARSGTAYTAALLGGLGLRFGHEVVFGPRTRSFGGWRGQHGDSSWLAAPFLDQVPDALVVHQLRHPLKVLRSLVGVRFLADRGPLFLTADDLYTRGKWQVREHLLRLGHVEPSDKGPRPHKRYRAYLDLYAPQVWEPQTLLERSLRYWVDWTSMLLTHASEERYLAQRIEELDAHRIAEVLGAVGLRVTLDHVALAMGKVPPDTNTRRVAALEWADVPTSALKDQAEGLARRLGYDPADPTAPLAELRA